MVDKARNLSKDFRCRKDDMLRHMQYFHPYLSAVSAEGKVVDIAVFCDVRVFEWLVDYISSSSLASRPKPGEVATAHAAVGSPAMQYPLLVEGSTRPSAVSVLPCT